MQNFSQNIKILIIATRYLTPKKIFNYIKLTISHYIQIILPVKTRTDKSNFMPYFISVETSNYCNLQCPECPVGINYKHRIKKNTFNFDSYKKLIDEQKSTLFHVILYFQGEPFLHPKLTEMIDYAHKSKIYTSTSTNGQFLTEKITKEIVLSKLDKIIVSIDGSTQEIYETYRVGGSLQKAITGIENIVKWKKELRSITPFIEIQFLVLSTNEHQMSEMKYLAKKLNVNRLTFKTAQLSNFENGNILLPTNDKYSRYKLLKDGKYHIKSNLSNHCWRMWSGAVINCNGDVLPCCFDKSSEHSFGNINNDSLSNNWNNKKASYFRGKILQNRKQFDICRNCTE